MGKRRRIWSIALIAAALCGVGWLVRATKADFSPPGELEQEKAFKDYTVKIYRHNEEDLLERIFRRLPPPLASFFERIRGNTPIAGFEILKHGRRVHWQYGWQFWLAKLENGAEVVGRDITDDGTPKLAVTENYGRGDGRPGSLLLFECGREFRPIVTIESWGVAPRLRDLDGDGIPEAVTSDNAFYHWPVCRDGEWMPEVILRWRDGKYVVARDLMINRAPAREELNITAAQIRASPEWESGEVPSGLWTNAIALMYSGHEALGWEFVETAWKPGFPGDGNGTKEALIDYYLRGRLEESLYWRDLKENDPARIISMGMTK